MDSNMYVRNHDEYSRILRSLRFLIMGFRLLSGASTAHNCFVLAKMHSIAPCMQSVYVRTYVLYVLAVSVTGRWENDLL